MRLMFSASARLMCSPDYWVYNGQWQGARDGDQFTICYTGETVTITDWVEIDSGDLTEDERRRWYAPHNAPLNDDNGVPF